MIVHTCMHGQGPGRGGAGGDPARPRAGPPPCPPRLISDAAWCKLLAAPPPPRPLAPPCPAPSLHPRSLPRQPPQHELRCAGRPARAPGRGDRRGRAPPPLPTPAPGHFPPFVHHRPGPRQPRRGAGGVQRTAGRQAPTRVGAAPQIPAPLEQALGSAVLQGLPPQVLVGGAAAVAAAVALIVWQAANAGAPQVRAPATRFRAASRARPASV